MTRYNPADGLMSLQDKAYLPIAGGVLGPVVDHSTP